MERVTNEDVPPGVRGNEVATSVYTWSLAVSQQYERIRSGPFDVTARVDAQLFALSLRNLVRAAEWAQETTEDTERIDVALARFKKKITHWLQVRDVLEHSDDAAQGKGKWLKDKKPTLWFAAVGGDTANLQIMVGGFQLHVTEAFQAAEELSAKVLEVLTGE